MTSAFFTGTEVTVQTEKCVYLAFTDDDDTDVREVRSVNGEEISEFLNRCTEELFKFALEKVKAMHKKAAAGDEDDEPVALFSPGKKVLLAVLTVLTMAVGFCASYFVTDYMIDQREAQNAQTGITQSAQDAE